jgi:hypothetical protein
LHVYLSLLKIIILGTSSTEYVRLKKQKEAFHFKCNPCSNVEEFVHLCIGNGRDIDQPVASSSFVAADVDQHVASSSRGRGRPRAVVADVSDQPVASSSRGRGRPRAVVVADVSDQPVASSSLGRGRGHGRNVERHLILCQQLINRHLIQAVAVEVIQCHQLLLLRHSQ